MATASVTYDFAPNTTIESAKVDTNFADLVSFLNNSTIHKDASVAFTGIPSGPASDPTTANQLTRKSYVDALVLQRVKTGHTSATALTMNGLTWTPATQQAIEFAGSVTNTGSAGYYVVGYPDGGFPNGVRSLQVTVGDLVSGGAAFCTIDNTYATPKTGFRVLIVNHANAPAADATLVRINYRAVGW